LSYFEKAEYDEALKHYKKAIDNDPGEKVHYINRGLANYHINRLHDALLDFNSAMKIDDRDPAIYFNRGNVYLAEKKYWETHQDYD
jgi:tetratricopeptide (TPR) repeat protein